MALAQELEQQQQTLERQRADELARTAELEAQRAATAAEKQQATAAPLAAAGKAAGELSQTVDQPLPPSEAAGLHYKPHETDKKDIEGLSWALVGMAAIGGAVSKGNWLGVSSMLNGAMTGFIKGDQIKAEKEWQDFQTKFQAAEAHDREALNRLKTVRDNKALSLNAKMQQYQLIAAQYDMQDVAAAAQIKSHDAVLKQIDARENAITRARTQLEVVREKIAEGTGADIQLSEADVAMVASGAPKAQVIAGYGKTAGAQWTKLRQAAEQKIMNENPGMTPEEAGRELASRQIDYVAGRRSVTQLTTMQGATRAAVAQLDFNINKTKEILASLPSSDISPVINAIARGEEKWTGDPRYSALFFYMNATAMESARILSGGAASVAQLHEGAREEAQQWANINMTPKSFTEGVAPAMLAEGQARLQQLDQAIAKQRQRGLEKDSPQGTATVIKVDENGNPLQ
jgi:hypothetical protein